MAMLQAKCQGDCLLSNSKGENINETIMAIVASKTKLNINTRRRLKLLTSMPFGNITMCNSRIAEMIALTSTLVMKTRKLFWNI